MRSKTLKGIFDNFLNILYPPKCIACAKVLPHDTQLHVCILCHAKLEFVDEKVHGDFDFLYVRSFFEYSDILRGIILEIKFGKKAHKMISLADVALSFTEDISGDYLNFDAIVPVPLHANRLKERGFNQAEVFARKVADAWGLSYRGDLCIRKTDTIPQAMMSADNRRGNVSDVFSITEDADVSGKKFVLVDDVFTSGETLNSLARTLKEYGAEAIVCVTICTAYTKVTKFD